MRRRTFIAVSAARRRAACAARAQPATVRRIGVLMPTRPDDARAAWRGCAAFLQGLKEAGWSTASNVRISTTRWGRWRRSAAQVIAMELVALAARRDSRHVGPSRRRVQQARPAPCRSCSPGRRPGRRGLRESLARPGGNTTGFASVRIRPQREVARTAQGDAPGVTRAAIFGQSQAAGIGQFAAFGRPRRHRSAWKLRPVR